MDELLAEFVAETREMLAAIEGELVAWEADPADRPRLDAIFRFVHTVKGNCGFFDFPRLEQLSHAAESALAEVRAGHREPGAQLVNAVLAVIDRIGELVAAIEAGDAMPTTSDDRLIAALEPDSASDFCPVDTIANTDSERRPAGLVSAARSIRLPVNLLDRLMSGVSDMVLARNDLARRLREAGQDPALDGPFERLSAILEDVRDGVTRMRMQRIEQLYSSLPRLVRDLSAELGRQVMLDLQGGDVELDRELIEIVRDPLTHIIRNAIDHGIERPADRLAAGKREIGLLTVSARQAGNKILLAISDDGRGLDLARICARAVAHGMGSAGEIEALPHDRKLALIFEPGLSTAEQVSAVSGRGVGMDVVRANLEKVGGTIRVESEPGSGTLFVLELPLTLSIIAGLTVECLGQRYAIPRSFIEEIARGQSAAIEVETLGETSFVTFRGHRVPVLALAKALGQADARPTRQHVYVFIRSAPGDLFALVVDRVLDNEDLVVKPLAPAIMAAGIYAGTTLLDDGHPILMLDLPGLAAKHRLTNPLKAPRQTETETAPTPTASEADRIILITDLAGRRRAVRMAAVKRIEAIDMGAVNREGRIWRASLNGAILPVAGLDHDPPAASHLTVLRLTDGTREILLAVDSVDDSAALAGRPVPLPDDPLLEGTALVDGAIVAVIDCHALFSRHCAGAALAAPRTCRLPDGDDWTEAFLRPLLEAAGYTVAAPGSDQPVDCAFVTDGGEPAVDTAAQLIRLRTTPEAADPEDCSIYRYDRQALLTALGRIAGGR
ncbi:MAG: chemotaxis protein CheA [Sphingomonadaceae bacterium]